MKYHDLELLNKASAGREEHTYNLPMEIINLLIEFPSVKSRICVLVIGDRFSSCQNA